MSDAPEETADPVVRIWRRVNPYFHIIGFIILCTFIFTSKYVKVDAYGDDISDLQRRMTMTERNYTEINTTLQDMRDYFHIPRHERITDASDHR